MRHPTPLKDARNPQVAKAERQHACGQGRGKNQGSSGVDRRTDQGKEGTGRLPGIGMGHGSAERWENPCARVGVAPCRAWKHRHHGEGWRDQRVDHQRGGVGSQGQRSACEGECRAQGADPFDGKTAALFLRQREGEVRLRLTCHPWPDGQAHRTADTQHGWIPVRVEDCQVGNQRLEKLDGRHVIGRIQGLFWEISDGGAAVPMLQKHQAVSLSAPG